MEVQNFLGENNLGHLWPLFEGSNKKTLLKLLYAKEFFDLFIDVSIGEDLRSQHYDNLQEVDNKQHQKQPLKGSNNTAPKPDVVNTEEGLNSTQEPSSTQENESGNQEGSRSLQYLETLAQKAGIHDITADDCKYDVANTLLNLDRSHEFIKQSVEISSISSAMGDVNKQNQQHQIVDNNTQNVQQQNQQVQQQQESQQQQFQQIQQQQQPQQQHLVQAQSPHLQQVTVNAQGQPCIQTNTNMAQQQQQQHAASMHQQQIAQQGQVQIQTQGGQVLAATAHTGSTTITTMSPLQQSQQATHPQQVDWGHGRVQVIQQSAQNPMYLQQLYNTQGQLLMPGNIALHPSLNPQQIQVITKPFQGNQIGAPHMLTAAQGKQVLQGSQTAAFPGYATIPTIPTTQNQQTLVFSQLGVISSQPNILPNHSGQNSGQVSQQKQQELHKVMSGQKVQMQKISGTCTVAQTQPQQGQCVQVSQAMIGTQPTAQIISPIQPGGQPMQFTNGLPWQFTNGIPQVWTTNGLQSQALLAPNPIFIRGTQADGTPGMFIQQNPQTATIQTQPNQAIATQGTVTQVTKSRSVNENIQPKQTTNRPLSILPSNAATIRPASSVSTQTIGAQTPASMGNKPGAKIRTKTPQIRSPAPKADAANQTQLKSYANLQQHHIVGNKMLVMNTSTGMTTTMTPGSPLIPEKNQHISNQHNKNQQTQSTAANQQQIQQITLQQQQHVIQQQQQQQAMQQYQIHQGQQAQQIQAKPMMIQTIQGIPQQQIQMTGDRPIMPVVSMSAQTQQVSQQIQQQLPGTIQPGLPLQPNLAVTQQTMQMNMQQIHPQQISQMPNSSGILTSQIQPTTTVSQVLTGQSMHQLHQVSVTASPQQQQSIQQQTQQVHPLPSAVPPIPDSDEPPSLQQDMLLPAHSVAQVPITSAATEGPKETIAVDAPSSQSENKDTTPLSQDIRPLSINPETACVQPTQVSGTTTSHSPTRTSSESGVTLAVTTEEVKERCPPKAMVKPQVLTHVIEDFVIQESSEPFPVTRSGMMTDFKPQSNYEKDSDEPPRKKRAISPNSPAPKMDMAKCEACGVLEHRVKFKKNKRFCSVACAKSVKDEDKKTWGGQEDMDSEELKAVSTSPQNEEDDTFKVDPIKWSVQEVFEFIKNLPGCSDYAEDFLIQEIDGQALMLLKEDHLMTAMAMKLGPALKIVAKIDDMRIDKEQPKQN